MSERTVESRARSDHPRIVRIGVFRVPEDRPSVHEELRGLPSWGTSRWIGRRMMDDPDGAEIAVVSCWDSEAEMAKQVSAGQGLFGPELAAAAGLAVVEVYHCRAWGNWPRPDQPVLLRIFRGSLAEGSRSAAEFDTAAMHQYVSNFERNPRCAAIVAGIDAAATVVLVTLWTSWDAIVTATGGDLRQVLPVTLPGWSIGGSAVHYELIVAETGW
jgi:hypothetical protein